jgi:alpha-galactosidase
MQMHVSPTVLCLIAVAAWGCAPTYARAVARTETVWLSDLDISKTQQGWGTPHRNASVDGNPLRIGGQTFEHGLGTHADSALYIQLDGCGRKFTGWVGVDDEVGRQGSVEFRILADGKETYRSSIMKGGDRPRRVDVDVSGVKMLVLLVSSGPDGMNYDHADWADAAIEFIGSIPDTVYAPKEEAIVLTPEPSPQPRINGARVFGGRPGNPFLYTIAATGDRPMTFSVEGLPAGLKLDSTTGIITGSLKDKGEYVVTLRATNTLGTAERKLKIVCGPLIGLTPALGWNSWNCFAGAVTAEKIRAAADAMVSSGLINHGWTYINIDDYWEVKPAATNDPTLQGPQRDRQGRIVPNPRFADMKGLVDYVHALGLKIGLYSSPGPLTCGGCIASYQHEDQDATQYGDWGFDYLKYDWCSYGQIAPKNPNREDLMKPYLVMRAALDKVPRDIMFSLCQYGMGNVWEWGAGVGGNSWRTTGDITDSWGSMSGIGFTQNAPAPYAGPGHWNDPDMLVVGKVGWGPSLHPTHLTPNEQYTHVSLWCLLCSPLLIGCDMTQFDAFTLNLLTNDEVLEVNQDPLGNQARRAVQAGNLEVWTKIMEDGSIATGLFNRDETPKTVTAKWADLGLSGVMRARDLWRQKDLGTFDDRFETEVPRHGVVLVRLFPAKQP